MSNIKNYIKNITPVFLMDIYRYLKPRKKLEIDGLSTKDIFSKIYKENYWGSEESVSGSGSVIKQTNKVISEIEQIFNKLNVENVLDAPCGDFNWMKQVHLKGIQYQGMDIVEELIDSNSRRFEKYPNLNFKTGNIIEDKLPKVDLIFCRDCLVHFSFKDIETALQNFKKSGSKYLLTTSFINHKINKDIDTGYWRPLNLEKAPFNFPEPIFFINEKCTEGGGKHKDKSLLLFDLNRL